jgi:hypothetical protein
VSKDHICAEVHPEAELRCWKRTGHDGDHLTVLPNVDKNIRTRPVAARW